MYSSTFSLTSALDGVDAQRQTPAALTPGKTRCPLYRGLWMPQVRSGRVRKISPSPGFDPRTVQPVASRYTDCDIPTHQWDSFSSEYFDFPLSLSFCHYYNSSNYRRSCIIFVTASLSKKNPKSIQKMVCWILGVIRRINDFVLCRITHSLKNGVSVCIPFERCHFEPLL